jgi:4-hydroxybenzoate polyprenyltransferase
MEMSPSIKIMRPLNLALLMISMSGLILLGNSIDEIEPEKIQHHFWISVLLLFTICSVTAGGYVINDFYDQETDKINKPEKCYVGINISNKSALIQYFLLVLINLFLSSWLVWITEKIWLLWIVAMGNVLLFIYSKYLKKSFLLGNFIVANLTALPYFLVAYIFDFFHEDVKIILVLFTLANSSILLNFIREIAKDWEDAPGDRQIGADTFVIRKGVFHTKNLLIEMLRLSVICHLVLVIIWSRFIDLQLLIKVLWPFGLVIAMHAPIIKGLKNNIWSARNVSDRLKILMLAGVFWVFYLYFYHSS